MRAKQSSTASGMYCRSEPLTTPIPICADSLLHCGVCVTPNHRRARSGPGTALDEGLLHDARNLMGAIRLNCDLLSMPGVLKPEHHHYAEELSLLSKRSETLIEHLIQLLTQEEADGLAEDTSSKTANVDSTFGAEAQIAGADAVGSLVSPPKPVSLRGAAAASTERMEKGAKL